MIKNPGGHICSNIVTESIISHLYHISRTCEHTTPAAWNDMVDSNDAYDTMVSSLRQLSSYISYAYTHADTHKQVSKRVSDSDRESLMYLR